MQGARYYDVRHLTGAVTHIDIDNTVVESTGTSYFDTAVIRVLGNSGWGILTVDNYSGIKGRDFDEVARLTLGKKPDKLSEALRKFRQRN